MRTDSGPLEMWALGAPSGQGPSDVVAWLRDVAEVAREGATQMSGSLPIPRVLYHAVSGLLFAHADAWGPGRQPCSVAFSCDEEGIGFGWVGPAAAEVWIDGRRESVRLVTVRDGQGRDAYAWSTDAARDVRVVLRWPASVDEPEPFVIELESRWDGREAEAAAWYARPAAIASWVPPGAPVMDEAPPAAVAPEVPAPAEGPSLSWSPIEEPAAAEPASGASVGESWIPVDGLEPATEATIAQAPEAPSESAAEVTPLEFESPASAVAEVPSPSEAAEIPAQAMASGETAGAIDPARPSSGIARWLQRNFGWLGRSAPEASSAASSAAAEPEAVATLEPPPPARGDDEAGGFASAPADPETAAALDVPAPEQSGFVFDTDAPASTSPPEPTFDEHQAPVAMTPAGEIAFASGAPEGSREDELAASAAALAAMLGDSLAAAAEAPRESFGSAWQRTVEESSAMVPPSPEPRELTARTAPLPEPVPPRPIAPIVTPSSDPLEITGSAAESDAPDAGVERPPVLAVATPAAPVSDEPFRPLRATVEDMHALAPAPPPAPEPEPEPEPPASRLPSWLRMPSEAPAVESPRDPREIRLEAAESPVSASANPVVASPPASGSSAVAVPTPSPSFESVLEERVAAAAPAGVPGWAESPAPPASPTRRVAPAMHPDWPSDVRLERPRRSRGPWMWAGAIVVVLFAVGWLVGMLQEPAEPGQSPRGPLGPLLGALGVRGPSFSLQVNSQPEGAWVLVDGKPTEQRTPATIPLAPGAHRVTLSFGQWGEATFPVEGERGATVPLDADMWGSLELLAPEPGSVVAVSVDGRPRGFAPLRIDSLAPGPHQLRYSGPGIVSWGQTVEIGVGEQKELVPRAVTSPATGLLVVRAQTADEGSAQDVSGARVWIDGQPRGSTPLTLELPRGPHSIRVSWQNETPPVQVIDLPGGNQRFSTFAFGSGDDHPQVRVTPPARIAADGSTVINATVDGIAPGEVREMWLHVEGDDHGWRRYPMTRLPDVLSAVGAAPFPLGAFGASAETSWYVSIVTQHGDEFFTEISRTRLEGRPAR